MSRIIDRVKKLLGTGGGTAMITQHPGLVDGGYICLRCGEHYGILDIPWLERRVYLACSCMPDGLFSCKECDFTCATEMEFTEHVVDNHRDFKKRYCDERLTEYEKSVYVSNEAKLEAKLLGGK